MKYTYQKTVTAEDVYGIDSPPIPEGLESTGEFRPPRENELYLSSSNLHPVQAGTDWVGDDPRIILRRKKRKQIILTEVGVGAPKEGQYWEDRLGQRVLYMAQEDKCDSLFGTPTTIYEREDKEI
jgi:hypothetical protein